MIKEYLILVGAAVATGDGEEILRTAICFFVVEKMREGLSPQIACQLGIKRILHLQHRDSQLPKKPFGYEQRRKITVAVIAMSSNGP
jgi:N4-(beta-N-acetylglucosaminyl)-L-asparaginase